MAKPLPRMLEVIRSTRISEHMLRVTLGGDALTDFPDDQESAYLKLMFPRQDSERTLIRTYTIRHQRPTELDVDFFIHDHTGPASSWAVNAQPGDRILVGGPGPKKLISQPADWYLFVGDMTALPAISVNLTLLPPQATGHVVIEAVSEADEQQLVHPEGMTVHWAIQAKPDASGTFLTSRIKTLPWLDGQPAIWAACEFNSMRQLRTYFKEVRKTPRSHLYISSYWKIGQSEDDHKVTKRQDADHQAA